MISNLKPYPRMKDSGISWLGKVPAGWEIRRNGRLFAQRNETGFPSLPILEVSLKTGVRVRDFEASSRKQVMGDRDKYKRAACGDIAYNMMRMWQGAVGVAPVDGLISPAYVVARPFPGTVARYFAYLFRTAAYMGEVDNYSRGIVKDRNRLYWQDFKQIPTPYPPPHEQAAIVRFLDYMDRRLRRYIRAKQKLIKLLEEQKQAIIHRGVTRGLDPDVPLKPSGVEWLGNVPEHLEVRRLKEVITPIEQGWSPQCDAQPASEVEWGVLKVGCVNREAFDYRQNKRLPPSLKPIPSLEIRDGDILLSRANTRELLGLAAHVSQPRPKLILCDKLYRFRTKAESADPRFLVYAIRGRNSRSQIESNTRGASDSMQNIGQGVIRNMWMALPSVEEQQQIVGQLDDASARLTSVTFRFQTEIELLQEFRTRLIADVVTGKLDVREAAARLPEEEPTDHFAPSREEDLTEDEDAEVEDDPDSIVEEIEA